MRKESEVVVLRHVWPIDALGALLEEPAQRSALIVFASSAECFRSRFIDSNLAADLVGAGVELFSLVGKEAEASHDELDWMLDELGADDVVTTWHSEDDAEDTAAFVFASCRASAIGRVILALNDSSQSESAFKVAVEEGLR